MAPIATQSPQPRLATPTQSHTRSSSFFSFLSKQSSNTSHHHNASTDNGSSSPPGISSPPAAASLPPGQSTPSSQQPPSIQPQPSYLTQQQQQMARTPAVQSPLARDPASAQPSPPSQPPHPSPPPGPPPLHPEIRSVVHLTVALAHKIYFSGPLVRRIERQPDGNKPHKDEGWCEVWAQLGGTTLSVWDMKQIQEASKQGREVPPAYVNVTDAVSSPAFRWF